MFCRHYTTPHSKYKQSIYSMLAPGNNTRERQTCPLQSPCLRRDCWTRHSSCEQHTEDTCTSSPIGWPLSAGARLYVIHMLPWITIKSTTATRRKCRNIQLAPFSVAYSIRWFSLDQNGKSSYIIYLNLLTQYIHFWKIFIQQQFLLHFLTEIEQKQRILQHIRSNRRSYEEDLHGWSFRPFPLFFWQAQ